VILTRILSYFKLVDSAYQRYRLLNIGYYLVFIFFTVLFYFGFTLFWDHYTGAPYLYTHKAIINANVARVSFGAERSIDLFEFSNRVQKILEVVFVDMDKNFIFANGGVHSDTAFSGHPLISIFSSIFFLAGLVFIFKRRMQNDVLLLLFLLFNFLVIILVFQPYATRIFIFLTPFLLFISCIGYAGVFQFIRNRYITNFADRQPRITESIFLSIVLVFSIPNYFSINKTFVKERNGYKIWYVGQAQIYDYLKKENVNEKSLVVFGIRDVYTWLNMLYINGHKIKPMFYDLDKEIQEDFKKWRDKQFKDYETIYFIFPSECIFIAKPGVNFSSLSMRSFIYKFRSVVPVLQLVKTIYSNNGIPIHYVYKMDKKSEFSGKTVYLNISKNDVSEFKTNNVYSVERLHVKGPATAIVFENGEEKKRIPLNLTPNMDVLMDFNRGEGFLQFYPNFDNKEEVFENVYNTIVPLDTGRSSIQVKQGRGGFNWLEATPSFWYGEVVFQLKTSYIQKMLDIRTNPRLFNDIYGKNRFDAYYSMDGNHYNLFFSLRSNKNERFGNSSLAGTGGDRYSELDWQGFEEYATYDIVYPGSKTSYVKFRFQTPWGWGGHYGVDLISHLKTMFFNARLDISHEKYPIIKESTKVTIVRTDSLDKESEVSIVLKNRNTQDIQERLLERGYVIGQSNSETGIETMEAIKRFQEDHELKVTGELDDKTRKQIISLFYEKTKGRVKDIFKNPGFEKWVKVADTATRLENTKVLNGWIVGGGGRLFADRADKLEGAFSARLSGSPEGYSNMNIFKRDEMEKVGGKKVTFSAYVKAGMAGTGRLG
ncbi:MAG: peptidoglycan-binding protein, partial [Nitrospinae bacterium]|nr:peptidoglycan-binding protein [Nitrospinota bacterium]